MKKRVAVTRPIVLACLMSLGAATAERAPSPGAAGNGTPPMRLHSRRSPARRSCHPFPPKPPHPPRRVSRYRTRYWPALAGRYFDNHVGRRLCIQVDKPLYKAGETIWFKTWDLRARKLTRRDAAQALATTVELVSPKGATVLRKRLRAIASAAGGASNDFELPAEYKAASTRCAPPPPTARRPNAWSSSRPTSRRA